MNGTGDIASAVTAAESRSGAMLSIAGMAIMVVVLVFVQRTFEPLVTPAWHLDLWMAWMVGVVGFWGGAMLVYLHRKPDDAELARVWTPLGLLAQTALNIGIAASPWLLLIHADLGLRGLMTVLLVWFIATEVMTGSEATRVPAREIVMLTASTIGFVLWTAPPYAGAQAFFLAMIGATMLGLRQLVRRTARAAVTARLRSEFAEAETQVALAAAAAERDAKTRFIASASHDLQQPLQAAHLFFEAAVETGDAAARVRAIEGARAAFASTSALIGTMLDHLRLEAGAVRARPVRVMLGQLIAEVAAEHGPAVRAAGMRLRVQPTSHAVMADPQLLRRALGNLLTNAVRHARGEHILVGVRRRGAELTVWVIDDGEGVAAADAGRLFDDYSQGTAAAPGGFGLGLASLRRSLVLMGGAAGYEPRWTGGAAFWLRLPLAAEEDGALCEAA